jgi:outer membrane lipoprotein LolB
MDACATHPVAPLPPPSLTWPQRRAQLMGVAEHFTFAARLAATHGTEGVSAGVHWEQHGADARLSLSGPLGLGGASLQLSGSQLSIQTSDGRKLSGDAADAELARQLGFVPPLVSLRFWVVGAPDPAQAEDAGTASLDDQQRLGQLTQEGWTVHYDAYMSAQGQWLPRRLTASRGDLRLRLVVENWQVQVPQ